MMHILVEKIHTRLQAIGVGEGRIIVAVSGGPDSMALLHALYAMDGAFILEAAHFNHRLRATAQRDEDIVRSFCGCHGIPLHCASQAVAALGGNTEQAGRDARYAFMLRLLGEGDLLATAHHQGDLAEGVLMNVIRGAGVRGLGGMRERRGRIIRPMLYIRKEEILEYVRINDIPFGLDETNECADYTRNRLRLRLIPALQKDYNPNILSALQRLAAHAAEDEDCLCGQARQALSVIAGQSVGDFFRGLDGRRVGALHPAIGKRLLRLLLEDMGRYDVDETTLENCYAAMGKDGLVDIGKGMFARGGERAEIFRQIRLEGDLKICGEGVFQSKHWRLDVEVTDTPETFSAREDWTQYINIEYIDKIPLILRGRKPGDRMRRRSGSKKLGDIMTDRKTPYALRGALPVLACGGELLWAVGVDMAETAKTGQQSKAIRLRFGWIN